MLHLKLLDQSNEYENRFGWTTIPMRFDEAGRKVPACNWGEFQRRPPDVSERKRLFRPGVTGLSAILGKPSGSLWRRDFDNRAAYRGWFEAHQDIANEMATSETARGFH